MSDELTSALRELANEAERPPVLSGAEIRGRASGRRRRRRTALAAGGVCVAGVLALVVVVGLDGGAQRKSPPAASPTAVPSLPTASPDATIDLGRRVISVAGHRLTLHGDSLTGDTPTVRMTVTEKEAHLRVSSKTVGLDGGYSFEATWALRLTGPDGRTDYVGSLSSDQGISDPDHGWIGLDMTDAKLLYDRLEPGSVVEIRPSANASASSAAHRGSATAGSDAATGATAGSGTGSSGTSGG
ncbi:L,D-transpeptidase [Streptomyces sp. NBC_00151]|uniref:L,D-transpeptidase n=1 Tax=Streptomyces sp. NBC_00151 TaxID=2975669 RepID=UPI002DDA9F67|nr:L,D-transpeptidase [Streptomyces sp. NBC_00151]WRZ40633.1 L,D-transpeptidase [Streptomyces sp. NBC_00151]